MLFTRRARALIFPKGESTPMGRLGRSLGVTAPYWLWIAHYISIAAQFDNRPHPRNDWVRGPRNDSGLVPY
jgi:hypothetical protein